MIEFIVIILCIDIIRLEHRVTKLESREKLRNRNDS